MYFTLIQQYLFIFQFIESICTLHANASCNGEEDPANIHVLFDRQTTPVKMDLCSHVIIGMKIVTETLTSFNILMKYSLIAFWKRIFMFPFARFRFTVRYT